MTAVAPQGRQLLEDHETNRFGERLADLERDRWLPEDVAYYFGLHPVTLRQWRQKGKGPRYTKVSAQRIIYRLEDVLAWEAERRGGGGH